MKRGEPTRAFTYTERALLLDPPSAMIHARLANLARTMGLPEQQIRHLRASLSFEQRLVERVQLAWVLATCEDARLRSPEEALQIAEAAAAETQHRDAAVLDVLAAARASAGLYDAAVLAGAEARDIAAREGDVKHGAEIAERLALYRDGRPYVEPAAQARG
jgi:hypothetical protein